MIANEAVPSEIIATLCDLAKLAKLQTPRAANPRILKAVYWLETARLGGENSLKVVGQAIKNIGWAKTLKGELTAKAILRDRTIAEGMEQMRRGRCPVVRRGPYTGQILSVHHVIPRAERPDLDNVIANLELLPLILNIQKTDKMGERQFDLEKKSAEAGLP